MYHWITFWHCNTLPRRRQSNSLFWRGMLQRILLMVSTCRLDIRRHETNFQGSRLHIYKWVFPKIGVFPPKSSILLGVFHYFHHPFWGFSPYFWKHPYRSHHYGPSNCPSLTLSLFLSFASWKIFASHWSARNSLCFPLQVAPLKWGDAAALEQLAAMGSFEMLVGSDVTYRPECLGSLARWWDSWGWNNP